MRTSQTLEDEHLREVDNGTSGEPEPGLVLVFCANRPAFGVIPLTGGALEIGRGEIAGVAIDDPRMSRAHARVTLDGGVFSVRDLESRNGTAADGLEVSGGLAKPVRKVLRAGGSLFLAVADTRPYTAGVARSSGAVLGPALQRAFAAIARAARFGRIVHITGESGSGKELSARAFHDSGPSATGPFVAVNAATLKADLAEAMLFGARKGFYTGAPGGPGLVQAAHGGTLFLDEVAELDGAVQAKLLRVLETREVVPLGETRAEKVDFRLCSATHADLRGLTSTGKMREDLYFRIATPAVALPPLRDRLEEAPWLIERAAKGGEGEAATTVHVSFVEACLLRPWPGNVRELVAEARTAAQWAAEDGGVLLARHLAERAGTTGVGVAAEAPAPVTGAPDDVAIEEALRAAGNNKARAARALGIHRNQLYRWLEQRGRAPRGEGEAGD